MDVVEHELHVQSLGAENVRNTEGMSRYHYGWCAGGVFAAEKLVSLLPDAPADST